MQELLQRSVGRRSRWKRVGRWPVADLGDANQVENGLLNLAINARDAMPAGGKLTLETANSHLDDAYVSGQLGLQPGQYVLLSVTDTGSGMPPDVLARAFEPFYTTKPIGQGTGLGLSQLYGFARQSGGHVAIYSEEGYGTTVKFYLPRHLGVPEAADTVTALPEPAAQTRAKPSWWSRTKPLVRMLMVQTPGGQGIPGDRGARGPERYPDTRIRHEDRPAGDRCRASRHERPPTRGNRANTCGRASASCS